MNDALKARLVGAAVLLIGLGLLWPLLFNFDETMLPPEPQLAMPDTAAIVEEAHQQLTPERPQDLAEENSESIDSVVAQLEAEPAVGKPDLESKAKQASVTTIESQPAKPITKTPEPLAPLANTQTQLDENGIPIAYVIQLGTFERWDNANKFRDKLNGAGYKSYIRPETPQQQGPYRVQVGPYMAYSQARQADGNLREKFELEDTFIRRFATRL